MIARLLISSSLEVRREEILKIIASCLPDVRTKAHPDILFFDTESKLGIEQARKIKEHYSLKPYSAKGRAVVLEDAGKLTVDAQNALLKTLEELPEYALFILGTDSDAKLLPTVLSRCQIIHLPDPTSHLSNPTWNVPESGNEVGYEDIEKLLNSTIEQRFEYIEKLKDREEFFHTLLNYFHKKLPANSEFVKELLQAAELAKQNGNVRAILEYLMLVMPKIN